MPRPPFAALLGLLALGLAACTTWDDRPRPYGFHRLELPKHRYQTFSCPDCPFTFEYPTYGTARLIPTADSCVVNIEFAGLSCRWHLTYEILRPDYTYTQSFEKYRSLIYKHSQKGKVYESPIETHAGYGRLFEIYGEVPTTAQVYITDTSRLALTNSFYFATALKNDSLAPVIEHMKEDLLHFLATFRFRTDVPLRPARRPNCLPQYPYEKMVLRSRWGAGHLEVE